jgi:hypothetical protein
VHRGPAQFTIRLPGHDAPFPIDRGQQVLHVDDATFDLDDRQGAVQRMPGEDVHGSALAVSTEGVLGDRMPSARSEHRHDSFDDGCVLGIPESGQLAASPSSFERDLHLQRASESSDGQDVQVGELAPLKLRHAALCDIRGLGQVRLSPATALTDEPDEVPDADVVHGDEVSAWVYGAALAVCSPPLITRRAGTRWCAVPKPTTASSPRRRVHEPRQASAW